MRERERGKEGERREEGEREIWRKFAFLPFGHERWAGDSTHLRCVRASDVALVIRDIHCINNTTSSQSCEDSHVSRNKTSEPHFGSHITRQFPGGIHAGRASI